jgi:hypothetical protein
MIDHLDSSTVNSSFVCTEIIWHMKGIKLSFSYIAYVEFGRGWG